MRNFLIAFLLFACGTVNAETISLKNLPEEMCVDDNQTVLRRNEQNTSKCILSLAPPQDGPESTEAKVHINSSVVTVYLASVDRKPSLVKFPNKSSLGGRESYVFVTKDKSIEIRLEAEVTGTSCRDDDGGSCCGDSYSGGLTVKTQRGTVRVPIYYYRGG